MVNGDTVMVKVPRAGGLAFDTDASAAVERLSQLVAERYAVMVARPSASSLAAYNAARDALARAVRLYAGRS